jgi:hypothetical protein
MRIGRKHLRILVVSLSVLILCLGTSSVLYSNSYPPTLDQIATAKEFHLSTDNVLPLDPPDEQGISGNLFSFGHVLNATPAGAPAPGVFDSGSIISANVINAATHDRRGRISGSFVIDKHWGNGTAGEHFGGNISISFTGYSSYVPPYEGETEESDTYGNYNFNGSFRITGGNEYYADLRGTGTITGTYQHHSYGDGVDFVMTGKAFAR